MTYNPEQFYKHFPANPGHEHQPDGLLLNPKRVSIWITCFILLLTTIWNLVTGFWILAWCLKKDVSLWPLLPLIPFGIFLTYVLGMSIQSSLYAKALYLNISKDHFAPGESCTFSLITKRPMSCNRLTIYLVGQEYAQMEDLDSIHEFSKTKLEEFENFNLQINEKSSMFRLTVPSNAPYSFIKYNKKHESISDRLEWLIRVEAKSRFLPKLYLDFPVRIGPKSIEELPF